MTATAVPTEVDPLVPHRFQRSQEKAWQCRCGKNHKSRVHHDGRPTRPGRRHAPASPGTVAAAHLQPGQVVWTSAVVGTDFGLPLVEPTRGQDAVARTVRSHLRESGGTVVRFTDGHKTRPVRGSVVFLLAEMATRPSTACNSVDETTPDETTG